MRSGDSCPRVVYLNPWESDFQEDALLATISGLLKSMDSDFDDVDTESIKETAGKLCKFAMSVGNDVVERFTGIDIIRAGQYAEPEGSKAGASLGHACFETYRERQEVFQKLKSSLTNLAKHSKQPTMIIVDELDRCRPSYAVEFLETINHFFDIPGLIFVLGVDKTQLASSVKALFGPDLLFDEYYRKFVHRNVVLPVKSQQMTEDFCRKLIEEYFTRNAFAHKNRFPYIKHDEHRTEEIVRLCTAFSLNARQIHELFRVAAHVLSSTEEKSTHLLWGWHIGTFFMATLSMKSADLYHRIGRREVPPREFTLFLKECNFFQDPPRDFWWAAVLYLGAFGRGESESLEKEFQEAGVWDCSKTEEGTFRNELSHFDEGYGRHHARQPPFSEIYEILEGLKTFAQR